MMELMAVGAFNFAQEFEPATMGCLNDYKQFQDNTEVFNSCEPSDDTETFHSTAQHLCQHKSEGFFGSWAENFQHYQIEHGNKYLPVVFSDHSTAAVARNGVTSDPAFPITYCEAIYKQSCPSEKIMDKANKDSSSIVNGGQMTNAEKQKLINKVFDSALNKYMLQYIFNKDIASTSEPAEEKPATTKSTSEPTEEKLFTCSTCGESYKRRESLKRHVQRHTGEKPFICPVCNIKFCRKCQLTRHILVHTQEKPYECPDCGVRFRDKGNLNTHQLVHTGEKPFCCSVCKVRFRDRSNLKRHLLTHGGDKRFECVRCSARFKRKGDLKTHMLSHTGEKPFSCYICGTRFVVKSSLNKHLFTHTDTKPFKCLVCGVAFQQLRYLKRHSALHEEDKPLNFSIRTQH